MASNRLRITTSTSKPIEYFTEKDVIRDYAIKRKMTYEQAEDLYRVFKKIFNLKLNEFDTTPKAGMRIKMLASFIDKMFRVNNLKGNLETKAYKKAEEQLHYYLSGYQRLKII